MDGSFLAGSSTVMAGQGPPTPSRGWVCHWGHLGTPRGAVQTVMGTPVSTGKGLCWALADVPGGASLLEGTHRKCGRRGSPRAGGGRGWQAGRPGSRRSHSPPMPCWAVPCASRAWVLRSGRQDRTGDFGRKVLGAGPRRAGQRWAEHRTGRRTRAARSPRSRPVPYPRSRPCRPYLPCLRAADPACSPCLAAQPLSSASSTFLARMASANAPPYPRPQRRSHQSGTPE